MLYPSHFPGDPEREPELVNPDHVPEIALPDVTPSAFRTMLRCIYSDNTEIKAEDLPDVVYLAKKFQLESLRLACTNFMESGMTPENACTLLETSKDLVEEREFVFQFLEQHMDAVVQTPGWLKLPHELVEELMQSDKLCIDEVVLFTACMRWAVAECARRGLEATPENKRNVLGRIVSLIRFPCISMEDMANYVSLSGVLTAQELLQVFMWLGSDDERRAVIKLDFSPRQRVAQANLKWTLDQKLKSGGLTVSAGNLKATSAGTAHTYVVGNTLFLSGKYLWQITRVTGDSSWIFVGVSARKQFADNSSADKFVWGFSTGGQVVAGALSQPGLNLGNGPLQCLLDCDLGTLTLMNLSNNSKFEIKGLPKKDEIAKLEGGGFVPHICLQNAQEITVMPLHVGKFGKRVALPA